MDRKALIVGLGRAGKRHAQILFDRGFTVFSVDPFVQEASYGDLADVEDLYSYDVAVVATPPSQHLGQTDVLMDSGVLTLIEKPLCGWGEISQVGKLGANTDRIGVAYNYRWHPKLINRPMKDAEESLSIFCLQSRENLPEWGLALDHLSHDLDMICYQAGKDNSVFITWANYVSTAAMRKWQVRGIIDRGDKKNDTKFTISETVVKYPCKRVARMEAKNLPPIDIDADYSMFTTMWDEFLEKDSRAEGFSPNISDALRVQRLLEDIRRLNQGDREL